MFLHVLHFCQLYVCFWYFYTFVQFYIVYLLRFFMFVLLLFAYLCTFIYFTFLYMCTFVCLFNTCLLCFHISVHVNFLHCYKFYTFFLLRVLPVVPLLRLIACSNMFLLLVHNCQISADECGDYNDEYTYTSSVISNAISFSATEVT